MQLWGRVLVPLQGTYMTISLSCFADTETLTRWEKLTINCPQALRPKIGWTQKVEDAESHYLTTNQREECSELSCFLWIITIKLLTAYSRLGHLVSRVLVHCGPFAWESIKLFFSTSPKSLPLRFNLMSGYRGQIRPQSKEAQTQRTMERKTPWAVPSSTGLQIWIFDYHTNSLDGSLS